jgi:putative toxin-antitoxin system antitoxin component (TIGR02293 family)
VLRIARVASLAERVFEDSEKARRWLSKENRMLGARPLELLASDQGTHEVEAELNRIELGDFA